MMINNYNIKIRKHKTKTCKIFLNLLIKIELKINQKQESKFLKVSAKAKILTKMKTINIIKHLYTYYKPHHKYKISNNNNRINNNLKINKKGANTKLKTNNNNQKQWILNNKINKKIKGLLIEI